MTQSTILAPGTSSDASSDIVLASGESARIGLFCYALATPTTDVFTAANTGGTLADSTDFFYRVSALNGNGETIASNEDSVTTPSDGAGDENTVTVKWLAVDGATGYRIYGRDTGAEGFLFEAAADDTQWVDDGSLTPTDVLAPESSSADGLPTSASAVVFLDTPAADLAFADITGTRPVLFLQGPGTFRAVRDDLSAYGVAVGIFAEV